MSDDNPLAERGRSLEEDHFRRKDRELIEKMRQAAATSATRQELGRATGLADSGLLDELHELGFTPDTVALLPLVPVLQMAWAEGGITAKERELVVRLARSRGITEGSAADRELNEWMLRRPDAAVFARAGRLISAMFAAGASDAVALSADDLVKHCEAIAGASGGVFGLGRISTEERELLSAIAADLKSHRSGS
jgi:hypothetical protein